MTKSLTLSILRWASIQQVWIRKIQHNQYIFFFLNYWLNKISELIAKYRHESTGWNDKIVVLKKTTLQLYFKTFIEKINSGNLIM